MAKLVSTTYGEALFELALEQDKLDIITEEVKAVSDTLKENEDLLKLLNHPEISKEEKLTVVETIFKGRISDEVVGSLLLIVEKGRQNQLESVLEYFLNKVKIYRKIGSATVVSAVELTDVQKNKVEERLLQTTKFVQLEMEYQIDASIIGGMVIRIGDRIVDSSIKTKLDVMAKELSKIQLA